MTAPSALRSTARRLVRPVLARFDRRVETRLVPLRRDIADLRNHQHMELQRQLDEHWQRLDRLEGRINEIQFKLDMAVDETRRLEPHIAALEERVTTLTDELPERIARPADGELDEARSVLDEVRTEHARVRARLTAVARYEERIGRLEEAASQN